jgi:hypothetical protein
MGNLLTEMAMLAGAAIAGMVITTRTFRLE